MPDVIDEIEHDGRVWTLKSDSLGRVYAVADGLGRVPVETYKVAKTHDPLSDHV